jgi:ribosomal protein S4
MCKPKDVISVVMKPRSLKLINKNLENYNKRMRFYRRRLSKTVAFVLYKLKFMSSMSVVLQIINQGKLKVNNRLVHSPNYICTNRDIITLQTKQGFREIKLNQFKLP